MLTFLRNIRKSLIQSRKLPNYLFYASGEILLVMIGILLALQVNNWNEDRKDRKLELVTISELKNNIEANLHEINLVHGRVIDRINSIETILNAFSSQTQMSDSLKRHFLLATGYDRINIHVGAYNSYISAGSQIIKDENLRFEINTYFENTLRALEGFIHELRDDFYSYMLDYQRNEFAVVRSLERIAIPRDYDNLRQNESFILSMGIFLDVQKSARSSLQRTRLKSIELLEKVNERIDKIRD